MKSGSSWTGQLRRAGEFAAALSFLKVPRTRQELIDVSGVSVALASAAINGAHDHGLIYITEWRRNTSARTIAVWGWQPQPWAMKDAPKPAPKVLQVTWFERKRRRQQQCQASSPG